MTTPRAARDAAQMTLFAPPRDYKDLAYCRNTGWCWFCGERPAERVVAPLIPMCDVCKGTRQREVHNA